MEEEYIQVHKTDLNPKIVLNQAKKQYKTFADIKKSSVMKLGLDKFKYTEEMLGQIDCWKSTDKKYLDLDTDLTCPIEYQYVFFMRCLKDLAELPPLKTLKHLNLKKLTNTSKLRGVVGVKTDPGIKMEKHSNNDSKHELDENTLFVYFKIFQYNLCYEKGVRNPQTPKVDCCVILHGNNTLADLRDIILCEFDYCNIGLPVKESSQTLKDQYPSGMFYINNTFYIDKRNPTNEDYSEVLQDWGKSKGMDLGEAFTMDSVMIKDLTLRTNYPYLYQHFGVCEHFITVEHIKFINLRDSHILSDYPKVYYRNKPKPNRCRICHIFQIEWIVIGMKLAINEITNVCKHCFHSYFFIGEKPIDPDLKCISYVNFCKASLLKHESYTDQF